MRFGATANYLRSYLRSTDKLVPLPIFPTSKYLRSRHLSTAYFDMLRNHDVDTRGTYRRMSLEQRIALFGAVLPNMQVLLEPKTNEALRRILAPLITERTARIRMVSGDTPDAAKPHPATERSGQSARESDGRRIVIPEPHETSLSVACALGRILDSAQVPYAIGGALSFGIWAVPRTTFGVDFNYFTVPDDAGQMLKAIEEHAPILMTIAVFKLIFGRPKDWVDLQALIDSNPDLDKQYIRDTIPTIFDDNPELPAIVCRWDEIAQHGPDVSVGKGKTKMKAGSMA
ncbi:hypothetical protein HDU90_002897 [Geranomyces variabilis]|nr:hypothetical protein HDU90_002897 [Geranomyces variabilis]